MSGRIKTEIKQTKPFSSLEVEAMINLQRTADVMTRCFAEALKEIDLSPTQYNVLRILRGAGTKGLSCCEIGERMITKDPDITRLLDRMEKRGLVRRARDTQDRRVVTTRITPEGALLAEKMAQPLNDLTRRQLSHLGQKGLRDLIDLLERARESAG